MQKCLVSLDDNPNTLLFVGGAAVVGERGILRVVGGCRHEAHLRRRPDWLRVRRSVDRGLLLQTRGKPIGAGRVFGGFSVVRQTFTTDISSASVIMNHDFSSAKLARDFRRLCAMQKLEQWRTYIPRFL